MAQDNREAQRIKKEQDYQRIAKILAEINPVMQKIPQAYQGWDLVKTKQFKAFHEKASKVIQAKRIDIDKLVTIRREVSNWYGI